MRAIIEGFAKRDFITVSELALRSKKLQSDESTPCDCDGDCGQGDCDCSSDCDDD